MTTPESTTLVPLSERLGPVGAALPQVGADDADHSLAGFARSVERLGFGGLWTCELTSAPILDPMLLLAHVAATTERAMLGIAVLLAPLHTPLRLANQLASLDRVSRGRLAVGFGFGSNPSIYRRYGLPTDKRLTRYLDTIDLVNRLWADDTLRYDNGLWQLDGPTQVTRPVQRPHPPLFIGARQPAAVERCARIGDGWVVSGSAPPDEVAAGRRLIDDTLDKLGRDRESFAIAQRVYMAIDDDHDRGLARLADWFGRHYGNPDIAATSGVVGSVERIGEHVADLRASGVDHVVLNPVFEEAEQLAAFAHTVGTTI